MTLNLALDVTYVSESFQVGEANRAESAHTQAGGKGVNVARLLHGLGYPVMVAGFTGGLVGQEIEASLAGAGLPHHLTACAGSSRRTFTAVGTAHGSATCYSEPGPEVSGREWAEFLNGYAGLLDGAHVVVLSGSLPPGLPVDAYRHLTALARARGLPVFVDGPAVVLRAALPARPTLAKPNEHELAASANLAVPVTIGDAVEAARGLVAEGAERVVVSLGPRGLLGVCGEAAVLAVPPTVSGNPTGAGDAVVAALVHESFSGSSWTQTLRQAAAMSAAAVRQHVAGVVDPADVAELFACVEVHDL